jgi:hypothetical protein
LLLIKKEISFPFFFNQSLKLENIKDFLMLENQIKTKPNLHFKIKFEIISL